MGRSLEQIPGQLTLEQACTVIIHESIYRYIHHQVTRKTGCTATFAEPSPGAGVSASVVAARPAS
jgi:hypothetical protein